MRSSTDLSGLNPPFYEDDSTEYNPEDFEIPFPLLREFRWSDKLIGKTLTYTLDIEKLKCQMFCWNYNTKKEH